MDCADDRFLLERIMGKLESRDTAITGIGSVTGTAILSELGDISGFIKKFIPPSALPYWFHPVRTGTNAKSDYNTVLI